MEKPGGLVGNQTENKAYAAFIDKAHVTAGVIVLWVGLFYGCYFLFLKPSFLSGTPALAISGIICSLSAFGVLSFLVKKNLQKQKAAIILLLCIIADILINGKILSHQADGNDILMNYYAAINLLLLGVAVCGGSLLGGMIKKPSHIMPLAAAAGLADLWSVNFGVTETIIKSRTAMNYLLFSFPVSGKGILPIVGVTDFIFAAMFLSLSHRFNMPVKRTQILVAASFCISITIAAFSGFGVPVLPVMGVLFIMGQYTYIKIVDPKEKTDALLGLLIIAGTLGALSLIKYISGIWNENGGVIM